MLTVEADRSPQAAPTGNAIQETGNVPVPDGSDAANSDEPAAGTPETAAQLRAEFELLGVLPELRDSPGLRPGSSSKSLLPSDQHAAIAQTAEVARSENVLSLVVPERMAAEASFLPDLQTTAGPVLAVVGTVSAAVHSIAATLAFVIRGEWASGGPLAPHAKFVEPLLDPGSTATVQLDRRWAVQPKSAFSRAATIDRPFDIRDFGRVAQSDESSLPLDDFRVVVEVEPIHGRLSLEDYLVGYEPDPGFSGLDSTTLRLISPDGNSLRVIVVFEVLETTDVVFRKPDQLFDAFSQTRPTRFQNRNGIDAAAQANAAHPEHESSNDEPPQDELLQTAQRSRP